MADSFSEHQTRSTLGMRVPIMAWLKTFRDYGSQRDSIVPPIACSLTLVSLPLSHGWACASLPLWTLGRRVTDAARAKRLYPQELAGCRFHHAADYSGFCVFAPRCLLQSHVDRTQNDLANDWLRSVGGVLYEFSITSSGTSDDPTRHR